ncbi:MAG: hypothetical protein GYB64_15280 [Chloroflexi bacterium]|nr:hypothetical protein [Chloroflexota bacterium]
MSAFSLNRATMEFVGGTLYVLGMIALNLLAGTMPLLDLRASQIAIFTLDCLLLIGLGGMLFGASMRRAGFSWASTLGVMFIIAILIMSFVYVPLWIVTSAVTGGGIS